MGMAHLLLQLQVPDEIHHMEAAEGQLMHQHNTISMGAAIFHIGSTVAGMIINGIHHHLYSTTVMHVYSAMKVVTILRTVTAHLGPLKCRSCGDYGHKAQHHYTPYEDY